MAIDRTNFVVPASLLRTGEIDVRTTLGLLQQISKELNNEWMENIPQLTITVTDPPTQAEVQEIGNKVNAILAALVNGRLMDPEP